MLSIHIFDTNDKMAINRIKGVRDSVYCIMAALNTATPHYPDNKNLT